MPNNYQSGYTGINHDTYVTKSQLVDLIYPVGSIYISLNNTNPTTLFGGSWEAVQDRFLLGAGNTYAGNATGGEVTHTLTQAETPAHTHTRGTMNITGAMTGLNWNSSIGIYNFQTTGAFYNYQNKPSGRLLGEDTYWGSGSTNASLLGFDASRNWTGSTSSVGSGAAHNNMPPYLAVYMWKRTG